MQVTFTSKSVRAIATKIRGLVGADSMSLAKSLESTADILGQPNWDTLSGLLNAPAKSPGAPLFRMQGSLTLYVEAFVCNSDVTGPGWVAVELCQAFFDSVLKSREYCLAEDLRHMALRLSDGYVPYWDESSDTFVDSDELRVGQSGFWYRAFMDDRYPVESRIVDIAELIGVISTKSNTSNLEMRGDLLFYASSGGITALVDELIASGEIAEKYDAPSLS